MLRIWLAAALVPGPASAREPESGPSPVRPNLVFILADDLGYGDLGCYGQEKIRTPRLDRMAAEGLRFTDFHAGAPVCAPSRCVLLTGKHSGHAWIRDNSEVQPEGQEPIPDATVTVAEVLRGAGYATAAIGKWGLGPPGSEGDPNRQGFDLFFGYNCQRHAHGYYPGYLWRNGAKIALEGNDGGPTGTQYSHDLMTAEALRWIRDVRDRPFFLYLPYTIPHLALQVPEDALAEYRGKWPDPPYDGSRGYVPHANPRAAYAAMVTRLDRDVGRILDLLDELGLSKRTLVLFTSDNGPTHGGVGGSDSEFFRSAGPLNGLKGSVLEGGIRVPLIARWPGMVPAGKVTDHVSGFQDVLPTLAELAGASLPEGIDGLSLVPTLLARGEQRRHEHLVWEFHGYGGQQAVRLGDWKGIRRDCHRKPDGPLELYDLKTDLAESRDVAAKHPDVVRRMEEILRREHEESPLWRFGKRPGSYETLLRLVPAELRHEWVELPDGGNAFPLLIEARKQVVDPFDLDGSTGQGPSAHDEELRSAFIDATDGEAGTFPQGDGDRKVREAMRRSQAGLDLVDASIQRGRLQVPRSALEAAPDPGDARPGFPACMLRLVDWKVARARMLGSDGRLEASAEEILSLHRLGLLLSGGDGYLLTYLVGLGVRAAALREARALGSRPDLPAAVATRLLDGVSSGRSPVADLEHAVRIELCHHVLQDLPAAFEAARREGLGRAITAASNRGARCGPFERAVDEILRGHPSPLDEEATVRLIASHFVRVLEHARAPWQDLPEDARTPEGDPILELWPEKLRPGPWGLDEPWRDGAAGAAEAVVPPEEVSRARNALLREPNPVGRLLAAWTAETASAKGLAVAARDGLASREATRLVLACAIHERSRGEPPASLAALVAAGILDAVPMDPFSGEAFGYSRERRRIWSAGPEGAEDGSGTGRAEAGRSRQHVWPLSSARASSADGGASPGG